MGYGSRSLFLLQKYYEGAFLSLEDQTLCKEDAPAVREEVNGVLGGNSQSIRKF